MMTKKNFIALAKYIRDHPRAFSRSQILHLAQFCQSQSHRFMWERWMRYVRGECGPNGGRIRTRIRPRRVSRPTAVVNNDVRICVHHIDGNLENNAPENIAITRIGPITRGVATLRLKPPLERGYEEENFE